LYTQRPANAGIIRKLADGNSDPIGPDGGARGIRANVVLDKDTLLVLLHQNSTRGKIVDRQTVNNTLGVRYQTVGIGSGAASV